MTPSLLLLSSTLPCSVMLVALGIISFTLDSYVVVVQEILFSGGIMLVTTVFLVFLFIPKVITK